MLRMWMLLTQHTNKAADVNCSICKSILGCKYEQVPDMGWKQHAVRRYTDGYIPSNSKCPFSPLPSMQYPPLPWLIILCVSSYVDVDVSKVHYRMERTNMVTDVYYYGCKKFLGFKFVLVPVETKVVKTGRFLLHLEKLLRWDGNNLVYGHTIELVENA